MLAKTLTSSLTNLVLPEAPDAWPILVVLFFGSLFVGWIRVKSESIAGPWFVHAAAYVTVALVVASSSF